MSVVTYEGIVDHGQIRLMAPVRLPDKTQVYIVVPEIQIEPTARIASPRLVRSEQAADFKIEIIKESFH